MARSLDFKILLRLLQQETDSCSFKQERRDFLKKTLGGSVATLALAGCGTFDRWVLGDSNRLEQEVMILGGGLAGMSAAYHLKKNKVPYRLYEASGRVGGRIQTLFHFNDDAQFAELGAEVFEATHKLTIQMCKDLSLAIQDISYDTKMDRSIYWLGGKVVSEKEFRKNLKPLAVRLAQFRRDLFSAAGSEFTAKSLLSHSNIALFDNQSLADLLNPLRTTMDLPTLESFENLCVSEWGVDSKYINLLHFLVRLDFEEKNNQTTPLRLYRVEGGMSRMVQILSERVQGIVPDANLKLEHQLVAVRARAGGYDCTFKTPKGSDTVWARQVICAMPWSMLKDVDGVQGLELGLKKELIAQATYGTHSKVISSFKDPVWRKKNKSPYAFQGSLRGQLLGQNYWDSSRGQPGNRGLLVSQRGGASGQSMGAGAAQETLQDLRRFFKDAAAEEAAHMANWSQKPFAKGSRYNLLPGSYLKYLAALEEEVENESFYFAGEHMSFQYGGTMNGAIATGTAAAEKALQKVLARA
ncbi:flavin monoamine oxidase family protein [Bdellovibrio sp. HCB337]|uniref:flavin monoamine oxidase family protein n=1 Tax=Bdellovibrio sp. HCB337 TaxID=3394358 RepID=UPI0039A54010